MSQEPKPPFDRSFKEFFFEATEDGRLKQRKSPKGHPALSAPLFPEPQGDFMDFDEELFPEELETAEQERLRDIARATLPAHDEINDALYFISDLHVMSLMTAATIEDEFRGKLSDDVVDRLTASALVIGAENAPEIATLFPAETAELIMEFVNTAEMEDSKKRQSAITRFSPEAKHLYLASIAADLEITHRNLKEGTAAPPRKPQMEAMSSLIMQTASIEGMDAGLLRRAVLYYNETAEDLGLSRRLIQKQDGTVYTSKNAGGANRSPGKGRGKPPRP